MGRAIWRHRPLKEKEVPFFKAKKTAASCEEERVKAGAARGRKSRRGLKGKDGKDLFLVISKEGQDFVTLDDIADRLKCANCENCGRCFWSKNLF